MAAIGGMFSTLEGWLSSGVGWVSRTPVFAKAAPSVVPKLDRLVHRLSGGRFMVSGGVVNTLVLTTTGAKSGQPREAPLACFPMDGGELYVVGSNFGREKHPAWTGNLLAHPDALVSFGGETYPVRAHLLSAEEKDAVWPEILERWPNFTTYTERSGRDLRVFRLDRTPVA